MKNRWRVSAGVLDAGLASLATFGIGIYATRYFEPAVLGCYALVFSAFNLAAMVPRELVYVPAEVAAVRFPRDVRLGALPRTLTLGLLPALLAGLLISLWVLGAPAGIPAGVILPLTVTGVVCTFLSPVQDHLRRMLHIGGRSWSAASVSVVQVLGTAAALMVMAYLRLPKTWVPFGALASANFLSLLIGGVLLLIRRVPRPGRGEFPGLVELVGSGWLLLFGALLVPGSGFVAALLVTHLASAEALGYAEAARVLARPFPVLATGLAAVFRPQSIEAAQKRELWRARRASRLYLQVFLGCGVLYLLLAGASVPWNPFTRLMPNAFAITGLAAATIVGEILAAIQLPYRYELIGGRRVKSLTRVEILGATLRSLSATTASLTYAFAMPLGNVIVAGIRSVGYRRALGEIYRVDQPAPVPAAEAPATIAPAIELPDVAEADASIAGLAPARDS